jgi:phosphoribosylanthranilate isomerase
MRCLVKICGVTCVADALAAAESGADAVGLNFFARSPRRIDEATARIILDALPASVMPVMLAVNESWDAMLALVERLPGIRRVQAHHAELTPPPRSCSWMAAFAVKDSSSLRGIEEFLGRCRQENALPDALLVDAHVPGSFGGTGQVAPWEVLAGFDPGVPLVLAGGLTPDNVGEAIRRVRPWMVDVASGVESAPGRKDVDKVKRFIDAVRGT